MQRIALALLVLATILPAVGAPGDPVTLQDEGARVRLSNGTISITINKADATIHTMTLGNSPNLAGRGAYLAVANSGGKDGWDVHNADYKVLRNTPDLVELSFGAQIGGVRFTQYYVLRKADSGFYVYVLEQRQPGDAPEHTGQVRWSFYLNSTLFNYHLASDTEQGPIPDLRDAQQVQDATFRLTNGTVYTKYNYCVYLENDWVHGLCGTGPGSYGAFIITPSTEFLQAPTKQEITVHAGPIIHRLLASGHFLPRELSSPSIPDGWTKLCGPWMVYLNSGDSPRQLWTDAKAQAEKEKAQWPYEWMKQPEYPLHRGEATGTLKLYDGKQSASNALVILTAPEPDWQLQVLNYIFNTRADAGGHFTLPHVRPGDYSLFAAVPGVTDEFRKDHITVSAGKTVDLGTLIFIPAYYAVKLWEIGFADRTTAGFRLSDQPRQYGLEDSVPSNLTYQVGSSVPSRDWYYAQAKRGDWQIDFDVNRTYQGEGVLTIGIAGQTRDPNLLVLVNNTVVGSYSGGNSSALYRSAVLGSSYYENKIMRFPASLLHKGNNTVTLRLSHGSVMYDVLKLEMDDPTLPKQIPHVDNESGLQGASNR
jgi:rhamnogalacturonan endolyase